jgi:hypothetical protein
MSMGLRRDVAEIGVRLLDDAHLGWMAAEVEAEHALHAWFNGAPRHHAAAYLAYRAALDREEAAAIDLQRLTEVAQPCEEHLIRGQRGPHSDSHFI